MFCKGRPLEKHTKINQKSMKNQCNFQVGKKGAQNCLKSGFGRVLGSIWERFGTLWGIFWPLLDAFWLFFWRSKSYLFKALVQDELQEAFWVDFGLLLEGFGRLLGGGGKEFGRILSLLNKLWADFTHVGTDLALLGQSF